MPGAPPPGSAPDYDILMPKYKKKIKKIKTKKTMSE